jgi:hypothetical protein
MVRRGKLLGQHGRVQGVPWRPRVIGLGAKTTNGGALAEDETGWVETSTSDSLATSFDTAVHLANFSGEKFPAVGSQEPGG